MSNSATLDLRQGPYTNIKIDEGVSGLITWSDIPNLDTGYTIEIGDQTYTVGSGLTIDIPTKSVVWTLDASAFTGGQTYKGTLKSDSTIIGTYLFINIKLFVDDNS